MTTGPPIPFNRATFTGRELHYVVEAVHAGQISGEGPFGRRCQARLESLLGVKKAVLTTSCTQALELAALLLELGAGHEVVIPSFTFVSTANAFVLRGARPILADVRADTLNLDEARLEDLVGPRTRAVVPVHYAGVGCEMDAIGEVATRRGLAIVEDNAHGFLGAYRGRRLGTFGALATLSFHETKNVTCGEGGALLLNDDRYRERVEILRDKGTNRARFFRGQVDKYTWVDVGSSFPPSDILAAFLLAQLEALDEIQRERRAVWAAYADRLGAWAERVGVGLPVVPPHCEQTFHMFYLICPSAARRDELLRGLQARGCGAVFHYVPLHLSEMGRRLGYRPGDFPVAEDRSARLLRLPFFRSLGEADVDRVCGAILELTEGW